MHRNGFVVETKLARLQQLAREDKGLKFTSLYHCLNEELLAVCFWELAPKAAPGVDGMEWKDYRIGLTERLRDLVGRLKDWKYRPQPVRRTYIPKEGSGKVRPLGIPAIEDKIVQLAVSKLLGAIYEQDFLDVSYGFRPGRNCHQALRMLNNVLMARKVMYVVDADIEKFFDKVSHPWLLRCLKERIADTNLLRLIGRFLHAGIMEEGAFHPSDEGVPQGGNLSPVLSNVFLHYVLDLWFERRLKKQLRGYAKLIRYADDFVVCVQHRDEAEMIRQALEERLAQFGSRLSQEKTRVIEFGRFAADKAKRRGDGKPETFDFLGFTHYCGVSRKGTFMVGRRTSRKKFRAKLVAMNLWLKRIRSAVQLKMWWPRFQMKLSGHYHYYGVSGNAVSLNRYYARARQLVFKWLNRRDRERRLSWEKFLDLVKRYPIPTPRLYVDLFDPCPLVEGD